MSLDCTVPAVMVGVGGVFSPQVCVADAPGVHFLHRVPLVKTNYSSVTGSTLNVPVKALSMRVEPLYNPPA